jgi:hypothetical protein
MFQWQQAKAYTQRARIGFALIPKRIKTQWKWLGFIFWVEEKVPVHILFKDFYMWVPRQFISYKRYKEYKNEQG